MARTEQHPSTETSPSAPEFEVSRILDAPRETVFAAWTEFDHLLRWWAPKGFEIITANLDARVGGVFHYGLQTPNGQEMWGKWTFTEIKPPERIGFTVTFSDASGATTRHPLIPVWPLEVMSTVTLMKRKNRTKLSMAGVPHNATPAEQRIFEASFDGMHKGWGGILNQLAAHLSEFIQSENESRVNR